MWVELCRQAMFRLHLSDQQFYCLLRWVLYQRFDGNKNFYPEQKFVSFPKIICYRTLNRKPQLWHVSVVRPYDMSPETIHNMMTSSKYNVQNAFYVAFPLVKLSRKRSKDKPWITKGIKASKLRKNSMYKYLLRNKNNINKSEYRAYCNKLTKIIRRAEIIWSTSVKIPFSYSGAIWGSSFVNYKSWLKIKTCGPDGIGPNFFKSCPEWFANLLNWIFNNAIENGIYPNTMEIARMKGSKEDPNNYTPISLLSC